MFKELMIIFGINYLGVVISAIFKLPIPGAIIGMIIMLILLQFKILKLGMLDNVSTFLLANMAIFFISPTMRILDMLDLLSTDILKIILLMMITTFITMGVTGKSVEFLINYLERKKGANR